MKCSTTDCRSEKLFARGMCQACYYRLRRNGTVARKNVVKADHCIHDGCTKPILGRNLCVTHYRATQHPLNATWRLLRSRHKDYPPEWDRFAAFLADVGERPTSAHQLRRHDAALPWAADNAHWLVPVGLTTGKERSKAEQAAYGREWNLRQFGIDGVEYDRLHARQDGKCAICRLPETAVHHKTGVARALAVDHNHETGAVRGLLCRDCNTGLGLFDDDEGALEAALVYLRAYRPAVVVTPPAAATAAAGATSGDTASDPDASDKRPATRR